MNLGSGRIAASSGFLFVVLFLSGFFVLDLPGHDDSEELLRAFYADGSNRARVVLAAYLLAGAGLAFFLFLGHLYRRLKVVEHEPAWLSLMVFAAGVIFIVTLFAFGALQSPTYALSVDVFDEPQAELSRAVVPNLAYSFLLYGLLSLSFAIGVTSVLILKTNVFSKWLAWLGLMAGALLLLGIFFLPIIALPIWTLAASFELARGDANKRLMNQ
jgi:hypothetical protein